MFGLGKRQEHAQSGTPEPSTEPEVPGKKGRPTPSRREAEAARKQQLRIPKDPRAARKAARERQREDRSKSRSAMLAGDERYYPPRDQGPARAFARDFVDSRITIAEFFIFIAIVVLALGFVNDPRVAQWSSIAFFAVTLLIAADTSIMLISLNVAAKKQFPNKADRKGITLYATLRVLQLRRLRIPKPRVRRGGTPLQPKG
jgi:hypothetical protein